MTLQELHELNNLIRVIILVSLGFWLLYTWMGYYRYRLIFIAFAALAGAFSAILTASNYSLMLLIFGFIFYLIFEIDTWKKREKDG